MSELPYELVLRLAPIYESQQTYHALGDALAEGAMLELQRRGLLPVFRDGFANFIPLERDFANREARLALSYRRGIALLDSAAASGPSHPATPMPPAAEGGPQADTLSPGRIR